jgi:hypothetical protein
MWIAAELQREPSAAQSENPELVPTGSGSRALTKEHPSGRYEA